MRGSLLGPEFSESEIRRALEAHGAVFEQLDEPAMLERAAGLLADGAMLGWFQGRMEFGPRALGARSIIGDPRNIEMQSVMNLKIQYRELSLLHISEPTRRYATAYAVCCLKNTTRPPSNFRTT